MFIEVTRLPNLRSSIPWETAGVKELINLDQVVRFSESGLQLDSGRYVKPSIVKFIDAAEMNIKETLTELRTKITDQNRQLTSV